MQELYQAPLRAVRAFEKLTGLHVAIHDLSGHFLNFLPPEVFNHRTPHCLAAKAWNDNGCVSGDVHRTRAAMLEEPAGRIQVCHAGFVEWVVPALNNHRLEWVLFAGQRKPGKNFTLAKTDPGALLLLLERRKRQAGARELPKVPPLAPVDDDEALALLEMTRQLAARLQQWRGELVRSAAAPPPRNARGAANADMITRRARIMHFLQSRHVNPLRLADLAAHLHISESRAGHAVREACGQSFVDLLVEARLKTAEALLRHTNLSVLEVSLRSGFGDLSHFHCCFRKRFGQTPHRFRRQAQAGAPIGTRI